MDIPSILQSIRPGEQWTLHGSEYSGLIWLDSTAKPTLEEMQAGQDQLDALAYQEVRKSMYPPFGDFADAYVALQGGDPKPMQDYVATCLAVKQKVPKPASVSVAATAQEN